jgi:signal transduction histidine kinase
VAVIARQADHIARLIGDLLDVQRLAGGELQLERRRLDVAESVRATVDDHRDLFAQQGIDFELLVADQPLRVDADPTADGRPSPSSLETDTP